MGANMNCREADKLVNLYVDKRLQDTEKLHSYIEHVKSCPECYEELEITYMAVNGLEKMEKGATLDITKDLARDIEQCITGIRIQRHIRFYRILVQVLAILAGLIVTLLQLNDWNII